MRNNEIRNNAPVSFTGVLPLAVLRPVPYRGGDKGISDHVCWSRHVPKIQGKFDDGGQVLLLPG